MKVLRVIRQRFAGSWLRIRQEPISYLVCWGIFFLLWFRLPSGENGLVWYRELLSSFFALLAAVYFSNIFLSKDLDGGFLTPLKRIVYAIQGGTWLLIFLQLTFAGMLPGHSLIYFVVVPVLSVFFGAYVSERGKEEGKAAISG
jgi:hypothetical protein